MKFLARLDNLAVIARGHPKGTALGVLGTFLTNLDTAGGALFHKPGHPRAKT